MTANPLTPEQWAAEVLSEQDQGGFQLRCWNVTVRWASGAETTESYFAASRGKALAMAWRSDVFNGCSFGEFLRFASCRVDRLKPARWGDNITVIGRPAFFLSNNSQYVKFVYPCEDQVLNAHPYDVLPVEYRPDTYRDRDTDGSPEGGDAEGGSVRSTTAGAEGIATSIRARKSNP